MQGQILGFRYPRQTLKKRTLYFMPKLYSLEARYIFILSGNLLLREILFHIVNFLKSFDYIMFFLYILQVFRGLFLHIYT